MSQTATTPSRQDRRAARRTNLSLGVRLLAGGTEMDAKLIDMSLGGMALIGKPRLRPGTEVIAYVDKIARIEGVVARNIPGGFVVSFELTGTKERRIDAALDRLSSKHADATALNDAAKATAPDNHPYREIRTDDGRCLDCEVTDASILGITCESDERPAVGAHVSVGGADGKVVRHTDEGFVVEFQRYWDTVSPWTGRE